MATPVTEDSFSFLTETKAFKIPNFLLPPQLVSQSEKQQMPPPLPPSVKSLCSSCTQSPRCVPCFVWIVLSLLWTRS